MKSDIRTTVNAEEGKEEFLCILQTEHNQMFEALISLSASLMMEDVDRMNDLLDKFDEKAGHHFRFEEEAIFPAIAEAYNPGYLNKLYTDHDLAIARFNELRKLFKKENVSGKSFTDGFRHVRMMMHYIDSCQVVPLNKIPLNDTQIRRLSSIYKKSGKEKVGLISWSESKRKRKLLSFN